MKRLSIVIVLMALSSALVVGQDLARDTGADARAQSIELRSRAWSQLRAGQFASGASTLEQAMELDPHADAGAEAQQLLGGFFQMQQADRQRRAAEHARAVQHARALLEIAQAQPQADELIEPLREPVRSARRTVIELFAAGREPTSYDAEPTDGGEATTFAGRIEADIADARGQIAAARERLGSSELPAGFESLEEAAPYVTHLIVAMDAADAALRGFGDAAAEQDWEDVAAGRRSLNALNEQVDRVEDATGDLAALVSDDSWRAALDQTRLAKETAEDRLAFLELDWVQQITAGAEAEAERYRDDRQWYDALGIYGGLSELYDELGYRPAYADETQAITRRARILSLYGQPEDDDPDDDEEPDFNDRWQEQVALVDAQMVKEAIGRFEAAYVTNVDYRQVLISALENVRMVADTRGLDETFEGLGDEDARQEFLEAIDNQITDARRRDLVLGANLGMVLDRILRANHRTVQIPTEVVCVEFTHGMTEQLDDYTSMIWPADWPDFLKQTSGQFSGVGIQITQENGMLKVVSPLEDTPAYEAGIQADDYIVGIDGEPAQNIDIDEAVNRITGEEGTEVVLTIQRTGREEPFDVPLTRQVIHVRSVKGWRRSDGDGWDWMLDEEHGIGYIRLTNFSRDTPAEVSEALSDLRQRNARGVILDLRFNPGGYLGEATEVADEFLDEGLIVSTKGRQQPQRGMAASVGGAFTEGEVIVLVNQFSASAAEIVSGALRDLDRATIVGMRSFGKGSVQNLIPIRRDLTYLKMTTAYYYLPNGECLHRTEAADEWGVEPDVIVPMSPDQTSEWLSIRRNTEIIQQREPGELDREMQRQLRADVQLRTALLLMQMRLLEGADTPVTASTR